MSQHIITFSFTEPVTGFTSADFAVPGTTITQELASADGGTTWTVGVTPVANTYLTGQVVTLNMAGITDLAGNAGVGTASSAPYVVNTDITAPVLLSITLSNTVLT